MSNDLDFSLPDKKQKNFLGYRVVIILLSILIVLLAVLILTKSSNQEFSNEPAVSSLSAEQVKQLANKLSSRNLYSRAAKVWKDYLSVSKLSDTEQAKTLFQIGLLFEKSGSYEDAIEYYYRSEITTELAELEPQINIHLKDCFEKLGKFSALRYELIDRTSFAKSSPSGSKIVAEIGSEKITEADLDGLIESSIDNQLAPMTAFMTSEELNDQKKKMLQEYKSPEAKEQFLQKWVMEDIMYRQAVEDKLVDDPKVKRFLDELTHSALSQELMNRQLAGKINITETDLQTYYQANKEKFIEPAKKGDPNSVDRQKSFEEVKDQIARELVSSKSRDIQQDLMKELMDKYDVIIHTSVLTPPGKTENDK